MIFVSQPKIYSFNNKLQLVMAEIFLGTPYNEILLRDLNNPSISSKLGDFGNKSRVTDIRVTLTENLFYTSEQKLYYIQSENENLVKAVATYDSQPVGMHIRQDETDHSLVLTGLRNGKILYSFRDETKEQVQLIENQILFDYSLSNKKFSTQNGEGFTKMIEGLMQDTVCMVGRKVLPLIFNVEKRTLVWEGKNVPNDELDLQVPIYDTDVRFIDQNSPVTLHNMKRLRLYDIRNGKKRPTMDSQLKTPYNQRTIMMQKSLSETNMLYVASDLGNIYEVDKRKEFQVVGKFKNTPNASISGMINVKNYLLSCGLDGYLRVFDTQTKQLERKVFVNRTITAMRLNCAELFEIRQIELNQEDLDNRNNDASKVKKIRKRNKVGLNYLRVKEKIQKQQEGQPQEKIQHKSEDDQDF